MEGLLPLYPQGPAAVYWEHGDAWWPFFQASSLLTQHQLCTAAGKRTRKGQSLTVALADSMPRSHCGIKGDCALRPQWQACHRSQAVIMVAPMVGCQRELCGSTVWLKCLLSP
ncbi:hypothetical protein NQZ68_005329 [Dissostichus eleginoides]|nr:hypothetical protein NQZ68_005329 [Dissostichus eleginoides]